MIPSWVETGWCGDVSWLFKAHRDGLDKGGANRKIRVEVTVGSKKKSDDPELKTNSDKELRRL